MRPYGKQFYLKKIFLYQNQKRSEKIIQLNIQLIHKILNAIIISLLLLIFKLSFLSFDSQRKWSNTYKNLSKTKLMNNNLIDYISKTEEDYISKLDSLNTYRKTKPEDLIYLDKIKEKNESVFQKSFKSLIEGFRESKYQKGY